MVDGGGSVGADVGEVQGFFLQRQEKKPSILIIYQMGLLFV